MPAPPFTRKLPVPAVAAALLAVTDQVSKSWVVHGILPYEVKTVVPGFFDLIHVRNPGVAFSLLAGFDGRWVRPLLMAVTVLAIAGLFAFARFLSGKQAGLWGLGLVIGGAIGNLIDRARLGFVIDFIDLYLGRFHWPTFNVADIGISIGVLLLAVDMMSGNEGRDASRPAADR
mgnify:CR=1 FL=1